MRRAEDGEWAGLTIALQRSADEYDNITVDHTSDGDDGGQLDFNAFHHYGRQ
jgi:hypothetical protein